MHEKSFSGETKSIFHQRDCSCQKLRPESPPLIFNYQIVKNFSHILFLILSIFRPINKLPFPMKISDILWFSDEFKGMEVKKLFQSYIFPIFLLLMSIRIPKIKVTYLSIQQILKFKESSNQTG